MTKNLWGEEVQLEWQEEPVNYNQLANSECEQGLTGGLSGIAITSYVFLLPLVSMFLTSYSRN